MEELGVEMVEKGKRDGRTEYDTGGEKKKKQNERELRTNILKHQH